MTVPGPSPSAPLASLNKKQTAVSHSTPEAEIVAAAFGLRTEGMPALGLLDAINNKPVVLRFFEDNQAMTRVCESAWRVSAKRSAEQDRSFSNEQLWRMVDNRTYHSISGRAHDTREINYRWKCRCCTPYADPPHMLAVTEHPNLRGPFAMLV